MTYCLVPRDLAPQLHEQLRDYWSNDRDVAVVVERRTEADRRRSDRRTEQQPRVETERRHIHNEAGRRIADRRARHIELEPPALPRRARRFAAQLVFIERLEPTSEQAEDVDTARLVTRIQAGEANLFADLYMRYFDRVYNYLKVVFSDSHEAEDLTQQAFLAVLEGLASYERRGDKPFRAWLFAVVRNHALVRLRRRDRHADPMDPTDLDRHRESEVEPGSKAHVLGWISDRELLMFVERLPLPQRQVLALRYMLGLSTEETATVLGRTPEAVRQQQARALGFLRQRLVAVGRNPQHHDRIGTRLIAPQARVVRQRRFALVTSGAWR